MKPLSIDIGNTLILKKPHPCGSTRFLVHRTGTDIRLVCTGCGRDLMLPRDKVEKSIKQILPLDSTLPNGDI